MSNTTRKAIIALTISTFHFFASGQLIVDGVTHTVSIDGCTGCGFGVTVRNGGTLIIDNNQFVNVGGNVSVDGTSQLNIDAGPARGINASGSFTVDGTMTVTSGSIGASSITVNGSATFNGGDTNANATVTGTLTINASGVFSTGAQDVTINSGSVIFSSTGSSPRNVSLNGGTLTANSNASFTGTLDTSSGTINGTNTVSAAAMNVSGSVDANTNITVTGALTATSAAAALTTSGGSPSINAGSFTVNTPNALNTAVPVNVSGAASITGSLTAGAAVDINGTTTFSGTITANSTGTNLGTLNASGGTIGGTNQVGADDLNLSGSVEANTTISLANALTATSATAALTTSSGSPSISSTSLTANAPNNFITDVPINTTGAITIGSAFTMNANVTGGASSTLNVTGTITGSGTITIPDPGTTISGSGAMWDTSVSEDPTPDCSSGCCHSGCVNPLPVELLTFTGKITNDTFIELSWSTASELNNDHFQLQRSGDGINFVSICRITGNGTTNEVKNYKQVDRNPLSGINYYRLLQVDFNGSSSIHHTIRVEKSESSTKEILYPSPATYKEPLFHSHPDVKLLHFYKLDGSSLQIISRDRSGGFSLVGLANDGINMYLIKDEYGNASRLVVRN